MATGVAHEQGEDVVEFRKCGEIVAAVALVATLSACQPEGSSAPPPTTSTTTTTTSAVAIPTDLVGKWLPAAKDELAKLGYRNVDVVSVDGRVVIIEGNWQVVSVDGAGSTTQTNAKITIHVTKPTATPTPSPPPPTTTHTTEQAPPPPPPQTTEEAPAPTEVYYTNCADVRAHGAAPLLRGQPGYRSGLDRDGDGIACEK